MVLFQFGNGWVHGEQLSESAKVHPLLKPYRALSEKVVNTPSYTIHAHFTNNNTRYSVFFKEIKTGNMQFIFTH